MSACCTAPQINELARSVQPNQRSHPASQAPVDTHVRWCLYHLNWRTDVVQAIQHEHRRAVWVHLYGVGDTHTCIHTHIDTAAVMHATKLCGVQAAKLTARVLLFTCMCVCIYVCVIAGSYPLGSAS